MEPSANSRTSFNQADMQQSDVKDRFYRYFQEEVTDIQEQISQLGSRAVTGGERQDAIDHCLTSISRLSSEVTDASGFIPPYDQRTYGQAIKGLQEKLQDTRTKVAPKSRFQFKNKNPDGISINDAAKLANQKRLQTPGRPGFQSSNESSKAATPVGLATPPGERANTVGDLPSFSNAKNYNEEMSRASGPTRKPSFSQATSVNITGHKGLHIILPSSASRATSAGSVTQLDRCIVDMSIPTATGAPFAGLMLKNIKSSLIIAGHVAGAAHITGVQDSVIVVTSRQVRMHECRNVDIYLHCASRPIIEDCNEVRFAPIPEFHAVTSEEPVTNFWDQIDDFKWIKAEHSPNWSVLPEEKRLAENVWTDVVGGGPGVGLEDILRKIGIEKRSG